MTMPGPKQFLFRDEGFTLFELLVAVAILSMLAVPMAGGLNLGLQTWIQTHETAEIQERVFLTQERLRQWITNAYHFDISRIDLHNETMLLGAGNNLEFSTFVHPDISLDSLYRLRLRVQDEVLQVGIAPDFAYTQDAPVWSWSTLLEGVSELEVGYALGKNAGGQINWEFQWSGETAETTYLPEAIKVNLTFVNSALSWPEQIVRLSNNEQAFCRPESGGICKPGGGVSKLEATEE